MSAGGYVPKMFLNNHLLKTEPSTLENTQNYIIKQRNSGSKK